MKDRIYTPMYIVEIFDDETTEMYDIVFGTKKTRKAARKLRVAREIKRRKNQ